MYERVVFLIGYKQEDGGSHFTLNCNVWWGFLTLICGQHHSLMLKVEERKHLVCVRAQPDLAAAQVSEEMLIGYFRLLTKTWPCSFRAQT